MSPHILPVPAKPGSRSARPSLEQLEDRCVPSMFGMQSMGMPAMNTAPTGMQAMSVQRMDMDRMDDRVNPNTLAALNHLFSDFNRTLQQVLASQTLQQFFVNETAMIQIIAADLAQLNMTRMG